MDVSGYICVFEMICRIYNTAIKMYVWVPYCGPQTVIEDSCVKKQERLLVLSHGWKSHFLLYRSLANGILLPRYANLRRNNDKNNRFWKTLKYLYQSCKKTQFYLYSKKKR